MTLVLAHMTDVFGERRGEESGLCMWGKDNRLQLRVRQHFKLDLCRIGRACLVVRSEQPSLELPQGEVDDGHQDS